MLRALDDDPDPLADEAERTLDGGRCKIDFLKQPLSDDWTECCVQQLLATRANAAASLACFGSCLVSLGAWAGQHYQFQDSTAELWKARLHRLVQDGQATAIRQHFQKWYPFAVDAFGADGSDNEERYCEMGIKTALNGHIRQIFIDTLAVDIGDLGLGSLDVLRGHRASYERFERPERHSQKLSV